MSVVAQMRESDGADAWERWGGCVRVVSQVRSGVGVDAREWCPRCVGAMGRLCASGVAGAREMVAAGKTKLMHSLFPFASYLVTFRRKTGMSINDPLNENILLS